MTFAYVPRTLGMRRLLRGRDLDPNPGWRAGCGRTLRRMAPVPTSVPLTSLSHGAGCGCKLPAADLLPIVRRLPRTDDPRLLVGADTADDAAVFAIADDLALVQ